MREDFLHYVWQHRKFALESLKTTDNSAVEIKSVGLSNPNSGPDFFNAQIRIDNQLWAGNVEIHVKSSDWYCHNHETDSAYDNVILHVVWIHDSEVYRSDNSILPTLLLQPLVDPQLLNNYYQLADAKTRWIPCQSQFSQPSVFLINNWLERLYLERLEQKVDPIQNLLGQTNYDWEAVMFWQLARSFGTKVNAEAFWQLAKSFPFSVFRKLQYNVFDLEALLFGQSGLLEMDCEDEYFKDLKTQFLYIKHKFSLEHRQGVPLQFFRLRPSNFPTLRLAQLAQLYFKHKTVFSSLMTLNNYAEFQDYFSSETSWFWKTHYTFTSSSNAKNKRLSRSFIDILIVNAVIPMKYCHNKAMGVSQDDIISIVQSISSEKNNIIKQFNKLRPISKTALDSQALIQLKTNYCSQNRCLDCAIGGALLNRNV